MKKVFYEMLCSQMKRLDKVAQCVGTHPEELITLTTAMVNIANVLVKTFE